MCRVSFNAKPGNGLTCRVIPVCNNQTFPQSVLLPIIYSPISILNLILVFFIHNSLVLSTTPTVNSLIFYYRKVKHPKQPSHYNH